jgi:hypothetical protein
MIPKDLFCMTTPPAKANGAERASDTHCFKGTTAGASTPAVDRHP